MELLHKLEVVAILTENAVNDHLHHPGQSDLQDMLPSEAHGRPVTVCPGSCTPNNVRLGRLIDSQPPTSRMVSWRRVCNGDVSRARATPLGV